MPGTPLYVQVLKNYMSMKNKLLGRNFDDLIHIKWRNVHLYMYVQSVVVCLVLLISCCSLEAISNMLTTLLLLLLLLISLLFDVVLL